MFCFTGLGHGHVIRSLGRLRKKKSSSCVHHSWLLALGDRLGSAPRYGGLLKEITCHHMVMKVSYPTHFNGIASAFSLQTTT